MRCFNAVIPEGTTTARATTASMHSGDIHTRKDSWSIMSMSLGMM
jgi:hypothetical protein